MLLRFLSSLFNRKRVRGMSTYQIRWITDDLAAGHAPMSYAELDSIKEQGIDAIVNLCGEFCDLHEVQENTGFEVYYLPIPDENAPDMEEMEKALTLSDFEQHIFFWCIENYVPILQLQNKERFYILAYEDIVLNTRPTLEHLFNFIGETWDGSVLDIVNRPSPTAPRPPWDASAPGRAIRRARAGRSVADRRSPCGVPAEARRG